MSTEPKSLTKLLQNENAFKFSFEVTPDVSREAIENLDVDPTFFAVTWHAKSHQCKDLDIQPLKTASFLRSKQKQVLMHLSCDLLKKHYLERVLTLLQEKGICNLFLILGESYDPVPSDFKSTLELLKYIREVSGTYFCIGVAGFCESNEEKLLQLKEKIDAGANFIITQAFFEANVFNAFVEKCSNVGINVPILPGVFAFENFNQLFNFTNMCKVKVSHDLMEFVKTNENHEVAGVEVIKNLTHAIRFVYPSVNFHFFTMNKLQNVCKIIKHIKEN